MAINLDNIECAIPTTGIIRIDRTKQCVVGDRQGCVLCGAQTYIQDNMPHPTNPEMKGSILWCTNPDCKLAPKNGKR